MTIIVSTPATAGPTACDEPGRFSRAKRTYARYADWLAHCCAAAPQSPPTTAARLRQPRLDAAPASGLGLNSQITHALQITAHPQR
ncbi:MAG: hypothetical protein JWN52_252 [Actinomycetia bacterium]|nr:hypothetical protein [Actinomycetes bacterium]